MLPVLTAYYLITDYPGRTNPASLKYVHNQLAISQITEQMYEDIAMALLECAVTM